MKQALGETLVGFQAALDAFRAALDGDECVVESVFADSAEWTALLAYKLVPHLAGQGCVVAAVTGGTNTGKSTVFNRLVGASVSPIITTAAATRHPVLAANAMRAAQCLDARLVPEFVPRRLDNPRAVISDDDPPETLFVARADGLPDRLILLDTPDIDSIDKQNWRVAKNIRAAGDVLIAVLTGEKYRDERVVEFFRRARESGRLIVPLMNKADPENGFAVARTQLDEFRRDIGVGEVPSFALPHDFGAGERLGEPVRSIDGSTDLRNYLDSLDVPAIKQRVYRDTVTHFAECAGAFLERCARVRDGMRAVANEYEGRAATYAAQYDPAPGAAVGGLFHEFVQEKRGSVRRFIGSASAAVARGVGVLGRTISGAIRRQARLEKADQGAMEAEIRAAHVRALTQVTNALAASCIETGRNLAEPAAHLVQAGLAGIDVERIAETVAQQTLRSESVSAEFRRHAHATIEVWWNDHAGRRRALETLDTVLAVAPVAIAAPISMYTGGIGVAEAVAFAGPLVEQFVARIIEYQFGDQMFDLLSPWRAEQQQHFENAIRQHLIAPVLDGLYGALEAFEEPALENMRRMHAQCLEAL